jgi:ADP-ribose pyrophosphatase YjhB (NUDIX family)
MPKYRYNRYRDCEIDAAHVEYDTPEDFGRQMSEEFHEWSHRLQPSRDADTAVMWINVPSSKSELIKPLLSIGFSIHHANAWRIMFVKPNRASRAKIPSYGTHYIKVDCVVIERETNNLLTVIERCDTAQKDGPPKLVTGAVDAGEFVADASEREVYEETGIRAKFDSVIACSNRRCTRFDRDEFVVCCLLYATRGQYPKADGIEVKSADWLTINEAEKTTSTISKVWLSAVSSKSNRLRRRTERDPYRRQQNFVDYFVPT